MGIVKVGRVSYEVQNFKIADGVLYIGESRVYLNEGNTCIQVRGTDMVLAKLSSYVNDCLVDGNVLKVYSRGSACMFGRVGGYFSKSNTRFFSSVARTEFSKLKKVFSSKIEGKDRVFVRCSGVFDNISVYGDDVEVYLKGKVGSIFTSGDICIKGSVDSLVAEQIVYISK